MSRWSRPYQQKWRPLFTLVAAVMSLCGVAIIGGPLLAGDGPWVRALPLIVLGAAWLSLCLRLLVVGVYTGEPGIRIRSLLRTRTIPWHDIHRVRVVEDPAYRNQVLVLVTRYGRQVRTPLWQRQWLFSAPFGAFGLSPARLAALAADLDTRRDRAA